MKKFITIILMLCLALSIVPVNAFAQNTEEAFNEAITSPYNISTLRSKFVVSQLNGKNCACFSPVKGVNDTTKYPLVIFLHGFGHEFTYLSASEMPYWAAEELQSKFKAGGAHILLPQIFHIANSADKIQGMIDEYIKNNRDSIDTDCIVIMGSSLGGAKAFKLLVNRPGFYCAAVISCPAGTPNASKLSKVSDTPIWLISSKFDLLTGKHLGTWERITGCTDKQDMCRWMYFDGPVHGINGKWRISHSLAKIVCFDGVLFNKACFSDMYDNVSVVNGLNEKVSVTWEHGIIDWINESAGYSSKLIFTETEEPEAPKYFMQAEAAQPSEDDAAEYAVEAEAIETAGYSEEVETIETAEVETVEYSAETDTIETAEIETAEYNTEVETNEQ